MSHTGLWPPLNQHGYGFGTPPPHPWYGQFLTLWALAGSHSCSGHTYEIQVALMLMSGGPGGRGPSWGGTPRWNRRGKKARGCWDRQADRLPGVTCSLCSDLPQKTGLSATPQLPTASPTPKQPVYTHADTHTDTVPAHRARSGLWHQQKASLLPEKEKSSFMP